MAITLVFPVIENATITQRQATVAHGNWVTASEKLRRMLETVALKPGYYPDSDAALAEVAVQKLGARYVTVPDAVPYSSDGLTY